MHIMTAINALVFQKLFYCSTVWANTSKQNFSARIVTGSRKFDHITPLSKELCSLPCSECVMIAFQRRYVSIQMFEWLRS